VTVLSWSIRDIQFVIFELILNLHGSRDDSDLHKTGAVDFAGRNIRHFARSGSGHCSGAIIGITTIVVVPSLDDVGEGTLGKAQGEEEMEELHDPLTDVKRM
jgi:hypothetical protein